MIETVYAGHTVEHIMEGKAYARSLRAQMLAAKALVKYFLEQRPGYISESNRNQTKAYHTHLMTGNFTDVRLTYNTTAKQINSSMDRLIQDPGEESRIAKLWIKYLKQS